MGHNITFTFVKPVTAAAKQARRSEQLMAAAIDAMVADGVKLEMFSAKTETDDAKAFRRELKDAIVASFTEAQQTLLETPTASLSPARKTAKRYQQQQIGARINDFKRAFNKRDALRRGPTPRADDAKFIKDRVDQIITRLQNAEEPKVKSAVDIIALLKEAMKHI